ncbi:MAG: hypothetical protein V1859_07195 [archaeon]
MNSRIGKVLSVGTKFTHEYDFGTTTELELEVIDKQEGSSKKIEVVSRNNMPDFRCKCGEKASEICSQCIWEVGGVKALVCKKCAKKHKCGEDMLLPVVNSPRMGMCGYTGE